MMIKASCVMAAMLVASSFPEAQAGDAHWIWSGEQRQLNRVVDFQHSFPVKQSVTSAVLRGATMSAGLEIKLNGDVVATVEPYDPMLQLDVTDRLRQGDQKLTVRGEGASGPAAFFMQLDLTFVDGSRQSVITDETWEARARETMSRSTATSFGTVGSRLLVPREWQVGTSAFDDYEQWRQAQGATSVGNPAAFQVSPGFEIELVRVAQPGEDSWVSLAFDPQGRVVIAKEKAGLLRMTFGANASQIAQVEPIENSVQECRGLLFALGDLFVDANNSKTLFRLPGMGPDAFGTPQSLYLSGGGVGHGRNDLALGPDNMIYVIHGDSVDLPSIRVDHAVDHTSPFREASRGQRTSEGHLLRLNPKGGRVEILATGLRNPFGIDFNTDGEAFTYDADAEHDMGAPWYRPTRVSHLVTGGDYGWRGVTGTWPPYYPDHPDNAQPNLDIGKGSPTAVKFGTRSRFTDKYRRALFILDWSYGRIIAVHLTPRGSSYLMTAETFLKGRPLNVTDLDFGPDGAMYFVTGGRGTQSALYRVRYTGDRREVEKTARQETASEQFAHESRANRRHLESLLLQTVDAAALAGVWRKLGDDDPWIRHAARNVLERQPLDRWQERALTESDRTIALNALMALARANIPDLNPRILNRLNELNWEAGPESTRLVATYTYQLCLPANPNLPEGLSKEVATRLLNAFPDQSAAVNQRLSLLVAKFESPEGLQKTIDLLKATTQQAESMHYLYVLRNHKTGWTAEQRQTYFEALSNAQNYQGGAGMPDFLKQIRQEAVATLTAPERAALGKLVEGVAEEAVAETTPPRPLVREWKLEDLVESLNETGRPRDLSRGKAMFAAASCIKCHRVRGHGRLIGPDLTSAPSRFSRRDILESVISPSKVVPEAYRSLQVITTDGRSYVGRVALGGDYRSETLHIATDPLNPYKTTAIPKREIEVQQPSATSLMPEGLLNTLTKEEILDLLAFIEGTRS